MCEQERLSFIEQRDGKDAAIQFAIQTYRIYRLALNQSRRRGHNKPHHASIPEYRRGFVMSCLSFREYIRANNK